MCEDRKLFEQEKRSEKRSNLLKEVNFRNVTSDGLMDKNEEKKGEGRKEEKGRSLGGM